jgi:hypothetical protein
VSHRTYIVGSSLELSLRLFTHCLLESRRASGTEVLLRFGIVHEAGALFHLIPHPTVWQREVAIGDFGLCWALVAEIGKHSTNLSKRSLRIVDF